MDSDIRVISGQQKVRSVGSLIATGTKKNLETRQPLPRSFLSLFVL